MRTHHLNALRALEAVLRTGSFAAAAKDLGVTPAAVGQQVRMLEEYLDVQLFHRARRGVVPTAEARRIAAPLTTSFSGLADVLAALREGRSDRRVAITLPASFAEHWLTPRIHEFYHLHSDVDLRLDATNRMVDLLAEDFDFALRYSLPPGEGFRDIALFGDAVLPLCTPEFAAQYGLTAGTRCLEGVPVVHLDDRTPDPEWPTWEDWSARFDVASKAIAQGVRYSRLSSGLQSALSGQGLVLCGVTEAFKSLQGGRLVAPFGPDLHYPTGYRYRLIWLRERPLADRQRDFKAWILKMSTEFCCALYNQLGIDLRQFVSPADVSHAPADTSGSDA